MLDSIIENLNKDRTIDIIKKYNPDTIVSLISAVSWRSDIKFLERLKQVTSVDIVVSGDFPRAYPQKVLLDNECIDAIIHDFTNCGILEYVQNPKTSDSFLNIITRSSNQNKLIDKTYLGDDCISSNEEIKGHFDWCFNKTIENFKKENINFINYTDLRSYFYYYYDQLYYKDDEKSIEKIDKLPKFSFDYFKIKSMSDVDILIELYKIFEKTLKKV